MALDASQLRRPDASGREALGAGFFGMPFRASHVRPTSTPAQYLAALDGMEHWLDSGEKPNASYVPAVHGFLSGFVPPGYPY